jgi:outer membrane protein assembly factor BamD (BamD/ComL family)
LKASQRTGFFQFAPGGSLIRHWGICGFLFLLVVAGCAKYNTYYNASKYFREAEQIRKDRIKEGLEVAEPTSAQKDKYNAAIKKCQKILEEYPGSGVTDDALFLMGKSYNRLNSYRASIRNFDLLFTNFPQTSYEEEALYLQAINYLMIGDVDNSTSLLTRLSHSYPDSKYQSEVLRVSGENSFVLERWEEARFSFEAYLTEYPEAEDRDIIAQKLAWCHWELEEYDAAAELLSEVTSESISRREEFDAQLLQARVEIYRGNYQETDAIVARLKSSAETYQAEGDVALVEAENLVEQGDFAAAVAVLEDMPDTWLTTEVRPRRHDMLGSLYFRNWQLDEARAELQEAVKGATVLEEPERTRELLNMLRDYLAAEQSLVDARPERAPALKLLQANALLFGMERPHMAASRYLEVAFDANADSATAVRGLYGAYIVYQDHLALPDSASLLAAELQDTYPDSPQAFLLREGREGNLLAYLIELRDAELAAQAEAGLLDGTGLALASQAGGVGADGSSVLQGGILAAAGSSRRETRNPLAYSPRAPRQTVPGTTAPDTLVTTPPGESELPADPAESDPGLLPGQPTGGDATGAPRGDARPDTMSVGGQS